MAPYIERTGLGMLRHFMRIEIDNDLLTAMSKRWHLETHMFHLPEGEMTITLKDVALLTGLPISGEAIIGTTTKPEGGWGLSFLLNWDLTCRPPHQFKYGGIHHRMRDKCQSRGS
ncbi:unnamed protein product [Linum tenue]|uniref:Aminotransferase-like plant mobile domain-containing protein n=2 Tax=Linum tenue TaxID=586396 RepID=A0AAV0HCV8_9ROSI|nr:unnamed protein product [Linum tenue]